MITYFRFTDLSYHSQVFSQTKDVVIPEEIADKAKEWVQH